jgi:hypothetical protein
MRTFIILLEAASGFEPENGDFADRISVALSFRFDLVFKCAFAPANL